MKLIQAIGTTVFMGSVLTMSSGCGALGAMANPKVAWAVQDPAPMTVVVRRADAAAATAKEVDRLLTSTPANPDSDWVAKVGPSKDDAKSNLKSVGDMPMYQTSKARVVPSEVWIRTLPELDAATSGKYPNLPRRRRSGAGRQVRRRSWRRSRRSPTSRPWPRSRAEDEAASAKGVSDADKKAQQGQERRPEEAACERGRGRRQPPPEGLHQGGEERGGEGLGRREVEVRRRVRQPAPGGGRRRGHRQRRRSRAATRWLSTGASRTRSWTQAKVDRGGRRRGEEPGTARSSPAASSREITFEGGTVGRSRSTGSPRTGDLGKLSRQPTSRPRRSSAPRPGSTATRVTLLGDVVEDQGDPRLRWRRTRPRRGHRRLQVERLDGLNAAAVDDEGHAPAGAAAASAAGSGKVGAKLPRPNTERPELSENARQGASITRSGGAGAPLHF